MKHSIPVLICLWLAAASAVSSPLFQQPDKRLPDLQREREKLKKETDPVDRVKSNIKISEILLSFSGDAARTGDTETMNRHLTDYTAAIQDANDTLVKSGRDARKKPHGFKELEISLRRQINQLKDIGGTLTIDQREPVEKARSEAARIRDDLLKALFGGPNGKFENL